MSLDTLLEAANFLELRNQSSVKARDSRVAAEFHPYAKSAPPVISIDRVRQNSLNSVGDGDWGSETDEDRGKRRSGGAGTRDVHNRLEKNRRAHLRECFEMLRQQVPNLEDHKSSNLSILRSAQRCIQNMKRHAQELRLERDHLKSHNSRELIKIGELRQELADLNIEIDINNFMPHLDDDSDSDSTATACTESPILSDVEMESPTETESAQTTTTVLCTAASPVVKPMQLSSTSSNIVMQPFVKTMPHVTTIVLPVAPPVMQAVNPPRIVTTAATTYSSREHSAGQTTDQYSGQSSGRSSAGAQRAQLKTSTVHVRQQTVTQRALLQHIQQQQWKAQQQQLQPHSVRPATLQPAPQQVLTVNASPAVIRPTMLRMLRPIGPMRTTGLAINQIMPSLAPSVPAPPVASLVPCPSIITLPIALSSGGAKPAARFVAPQTNRFIPVSISTATTTTNTVPIAATSLTAGGVIAVATKAQLQQHRIIAAPVNQHRIIAAPVNQIQTAQLMTPVQMTALTQLISQALPQPVNIPVSTQLINPGSIFTLPPDLAHTQFGAHVLKSLGQIPIMQQPFTLQPGVVMVSLPGGGIATTTPTAIATVQMAATRPS